MRSLVDIAQLVKARVQAAGPLHNDMRRITEAYEGRLVVPLPELNAIDEPAVANLLMEGVDAKAQRISSVMPDLRYPPLRAGFDVHEQRAREQRQANLAWWEMSDLEIVMARRARHLIGYTCSPVAVVPDFKRGIPRWEVRDPLCTLPAPSSRFDQILPADSVSVYSRTIDFIKTEWPHRFGWIGPRAGWTVSNDDTAIVCEYVDEHEVVHVVVGTSDRALDRYGIADASDFVWVGNVGDGGRVYDFAVELDRHPNRAGMPTTVVPGVVNLAAAVSEFKGMIGKYITQARLQALELIGIEEGIRPFAYFVQTEQQGGIMAHANPRQGELGHVKGGKIEVLNMQPSYLANVAADRLERAQRLEGGVPAAVSGETTTNVRTGRMGEQLLSASIDPGIAEKQRILQRSLRYENEVAVAVAKGYFGARPVSFHVNWKGARGPVSYTAGELFDNAPPSSVVFPVVGADAQSLVIGLGQRLGTGLMSQQTARRMDPWVPDEESESDQIVAEGLELALMQAIQQQAAQGLIPPDDVATLIDTVRQNRAGLPKAVHEIQRKAQERQATTVEPAEPGSPETQPGIAQPGMGAEAGVAIPEPGPSQDNFAQLLNQLRTARSSMTAAQRAG